MTDNIERLNEANKEGEALERLYDVKQDEQEKVYYKYRKAQSGFLEIMRELHRFRGGFLDNYSLRSKIENTYQKHEDVAKLMDKQSRKLVVEQAKLDSFVEASQDMFDSKLVNFIKDIRKIKVRNVVHLSPTFHKRWLITLDHIKAIQMQKRSHEYCKHLKRNVVINNQTDATTEFASGKITKNTLT